MIYPIDFLLLERTLPRKHAPAWPYWTRVSCSSTDEEPSERGTLLVRGKPQANTKSCRSKAISDQTFLGLPHVEPNPYQSLVPSIPPIEPQPPNCAGATGNLAEGNWPGAGAGPQIDQLPSNCVVWIGGPVVGHGGKPHLAVAPKMAWLQK